MGVYEERCYVCKSEIPINNTVTYFPGPDDDVLVCSDCESVIYALDKETYANWWVHINKIEEIKDWIHRIKTEWLKVKCSACEIEGTLADEWGRDINFFVDMRIRRDFKVMFLCSRCEKIARSFKSYPNWRNDIGHIRNVVSLEEIVGLKGEPRWTFTHQIVTFVKK